jgi:hypothetical protein
MNTYCRKSGIFLEIRRQRHPQKAQKSSLPFVENHHDTHTPDIPAKMEGGEYEILFGEGE